MFQGREGFAQGLLVGISYCDFYNLNMQGPERGKSESISCELINQLPAPLATVSSQLAQRTGEAEVIATVVQKAPECLYCSVTL